MYDNMTNVHGRDTTRLLFLNDTEDDYHFGCTATSRAIKAEISRICPSAEIVSVGVQEVWREGLSDRIADLIRESRDVFVNGEGTILGYEGRQGTQNILKIIEFAEENRRNVSIINHSCFPVFSPYETSECEAVYKWVYSKLHSCVVRDMRSLAILNRMGISSVKLGFDCSPIYVEQLYKEVPISLETGSYIVLGGGISFEKHFDSFLENSAEELQEKFGKKLVFLFSATKVKAADDERCIEKIASFNKGKQQKIEVYTAKNVDEFISVIKNAAFQISGRFHHSVIAAATGTKFICFSTHSPKNEVFRDLLAESYIPVEAVMASIVPQVETMLAADWSKINRDALVSLAQNNFSAVGMQGEEKWGDIFRLAEASHPAVFGKYRNCHAGKEIVILAAGPTLDKYMPIPGAIHIGMNKVFYSGKADLDYLFMQDFIPSAQDDADAYRPGLCKKFYGAHYLVPAISDAHLEKAKAERYFFIDGGYGDSPWKGPRDISRMPLFAFSSVAHPAVLFALWTGAKRIYLVGCDTNLQGYASGMKYKNASSNTLCVDNVLIGWSRIKAFAEICYPETEIVSINPIGLRGLFRDVYTENYLAEHPDLKNVEVFAGTLGPRPTARTEKTRPAAAGVVKEDSTRELLWDAVCNRDHTIAQLSSALTATRDIINKQHEGIEAKDAALFQFQEAVAGLRKNDEMQREAIAVNDTALTQLQEAVVGLRDNVEKQCEAIAAKDAALARLKESVAGLRDNADKQRKTIAAKDAALARLKESVAGLKDNAEKQREAIAARDAALTRLKESVAGLKDNAEKQRKTIAAKDAALTQLKESVAELRANAEKQREEIAGKNRGIGWLSRIVSAIKRRC